MKKPSVPSAEDDSKGEGDILNETAFKLSHL